MAQESWGSAIGFTLFWLVVGYGLGLVSGTGIANDWWKADMVDRGFAHYVTDGKSAGKWEWKTQP